MPRYPKLFTLYSTHEYRKSIEHRTEEIAFAKDEEEVADKSCNARRSRGAYERQRPQEVILSRIVSRSQLSDTMGNMKFTNVAVFVIFFGIALIEALQKQNWLEAALFAALGVLSLWADFRKKS